MINVDDQQIMVLRKMEIQMAVACVFSIPRNAMGLIIDYTWDIEYDDDLVSFDLSKL